MIKKVAIFPLAEGSANPYQKLFIEGFEKINVEVFIPEYKNPFPILKAIEQCENCDAIILDWIHSVYTSRKTTTTLAKLLLGELERYKLKKHSEVPIIWNIHNLHRHDKLFLRIEKWHFRRFSKLVSGLRVFNQFSIDAVKTYLSLTEEKKIKHIPHGNYIEVYKGIERKDIRSRFGAKNEDIVLLVFGGIREGKGIVAFLKAFTRLNQKSLKLIIAGKGDSEDIEREIQKIASSDERIFTDLRYIPDEEVPSFFFSSDYVVLPYKHILNSGAAVLAMGFKKPIIANSISALKETLDERFAFFGDLYSQKDLQLLINNILQQNNQAKIMGENAFEMARQLSWEKIATKMCHFIEEVKASES